MPTELKKLQRRPFLVPLLLPALLAVGVVALGAWVLDARATTLVIVARNAEADADTNPDPDLNLAGKERAAKLARMLANPHRLDAARRAIDAVFAMDTRKSQQTAAPVAEALSLPVSVLPTTSVQDLARRIRREHRGGTVLVIANNTVIPKLLDELIGKEIVVDDKEYDRLELLFIPRLSRARLFEIRY